MEGRDLPLDVIRIQVGQETYYTGFYVKSHHIFETGGQWYLFDVSACSAKLINEALALAVLSADERSGVATESEIEILSSLDLIQGNAELASSSLMSATENDTSSGPASVRSLTLNVFQACNLACKYCFAGDGSYGSSGRMKPNVARAAVDWYVKQHRWEAFEINFFGGEPLANFSLIREVTEYARAVAGGVSKAIAFNVTTNATLVNDEIAQFPADHKFKVAVSIDGSRDVHDRNRPTKGGRPSFSRVVAGLEKLRAAGIHLVGRSTLYGQIEDIQSQREVLDKLGFDEISISRATPPANLRAHASPSLSFDDPSQLSAVLDNARLERIEALASDESKPRRKGIVSSLARQIAGKGKQDFGCGVGKELVSVDIDGNLYACHRYTNSNEHKMGDVYSGLAVSPRFVDVPVDQMPKCKSCWARYVCAGGCRHDNEMRTGDPFLPSEEFCCEMKSYVENGIVVACDPNFKG